MAVQVSPSAVETNTAVLVQKPTTYPRAVYMMPTKFYLPAGALSLSGVVRADGVLASRRVRLYDSETGELIDETTSAGDGTYSFAGRDARSEKYFVVMEGVAGSGERHAIIPEVQPS